MVDIRCLIVIALVGLMSCAQPKEVVDLSEFILQDGYEIEQIASEPLLDSPIAMTFDYDGSIWAVELPGYMRDIEGSQEEAADGKIVHLTDTDGDGVMDEREVVKDELVAPRAVSIAYGGLLYTAGTSLWWDDLSDDREAELVDSLYVIGGNIEHQPNGLLYNLDNWIYSAKANARYRKINGTWAKEATTFRGQWGITHDAKGRLFYNDNSNPLYGDYTPPNILINNPYQKIKHGLSQNIAPDRRLFAIQANDVNRGYIPGVLDSTGRVTEFTSACGPLIHLSDGLGGEANGDAFVCGPEANLVKRYSLSQVGAKIETKQTYENEEFLISTDDTFRPVNLYTGPDGSMYILDLRKGVIQHRAYMTSYLREIILNKKLDELSGKGRIYRVSEIDHVKEVNLPKSTEDWIAALSSTNGAMRIMAQKRLVGSNDTSLGERLIRMATEDSNSIGRIHALWTLEGLGLLNQELLLDISTEGINNELWYAVIQLSNEQSKDKLLALLPDQLTPDLELLVATISDRYIDTTDPILAEATISGMNEKAIKESLKSNIYSSEMKQLMEVVSTNIEQNDIQAPQLMTNFFKDNRTAGLDLYIKNCSSCHGLDGKGRDNLAPPIMQSEYVGGSTDQLILLLLHGLKGPIKVKGVEYDMNLVMPGIKDNDLLTDKDIADIIIFVRNSFSFADPRVAHQRVAELRTLTADRSDMFTEEELLNWKSE